MGAGGGGRLDGRTTKGETMSRTIQADVRQIGGSHSRGTAREHTVEIDRPRAKGGTDRGAMGGELLLLALGGCFMSNLLAAIRARDAAISDARASVEAVLDGDPERVTAFTMRVEARTDDLELLEKLVTIAERGCMVTNTLKETAPVTVKAEALAP